MRQAAFARRDGLSRDDRTSWSRAIADTVLALPELYGIEPVGAYWPMRSEVDPRPIMERLCGCGTLVALSQIRHPLLSWRQWQSGAVLVRGGFGVLEPGPDAPEVFPRALLVPLCAFDRRGGRLGYGKGHFDRAIAGLASRHRLLTVGLAFAAQEIAQVPTDAHDRRLDLVVTQAEIIRSGFDLPGQGVDRT